MGQSASDEPYATGDGNEQAENGVIFPATDAEIPEQGSNETASETTESLDQNTAVILCLSILIMLLGRRQ
ncbi:MAG: hypothetical protein U9N13_05100 [Euryarchaeota archaeon]|nr:hypothetical protein [Euryarchaeota archaeon]